MQNCFMVPVFGGVLGQGHVRRCNCEDFWRSSSLQTMTPWLIACSLQWANRLVGVPAIPSKCGSTKTIYKSTSQSEEMFQT